MVNDPYFSLYRSQTRLLREYEKHPKLIVAVDFDDTVFDFHEEGCQFPEVWRVLRNAQDIGFYVVAFTASRPERYEFINKYFEINGILLDSINKNPIELPYGNNGKIFYNILLDDRAGLKEATLILDFVTTVIKERKISEIVCASPNGFLQDGTY